MNCLFWSKRVLAKMMVAFATGVVVLVAAPSFGDTTIFETDFNSYSVGPLEGRLGWEKFATGSGSTATVASAVGTGLSRGVEVSREVGDNAYWYQAPLAYLGPERYIDISWDMNVSEALTGASLFGPFFGVLGNDAIGGWLGALGVDGATGELMYSGGAGGALIVVGPSAIVDFDTWHSYKIRLDFDTDKYSLFMDGTDLLVLDDFVDPAVVHSFTDARIMATLSDAGGVDAVGTAYYDNFNVTAVPEPSTLVLCLAAFLPLALIAARRRLRANVA